MPGPQKRKYRARTSTSTRLKEMASEDRGGGRAHLGHVPNNTGAATVMRKKYTPEAAAPVLQRRGALARCPKE